MKKFLCYDTNDAASGRVNVSANGVLKPNSTVPSTNSAAYQQLVTGGDGNTKWEDRLAYEDSRLVVDVREGFRIVKVSDEIPSWASVDASMKVWYSNGKNHTVNPENYTVFGNGSFAAFDASVFAFFIATDNVEFELYNIVFPKKGVYFISIDGVITTGIASADSDTPEITWDGSLETIKKIDEKFLPEPLILYVHESESGV